jgi:hypothetical protein
LHRRLGRLLGLLCCQDEGLYANGPALHRGHLCFERRETIAVLFLEGVEVVFELIDFLLQHFRAFRLRLRERFGRFR